MPRSHCRLLSLALIGIPPASGFISKWYLAQGALDAEVGIFRWLGPAVLLISALLTAGYLLPVVMKGFFPGKEFDADTDKLSLEPSMWMLAPLAVCAVLAVILGIFPSPLIQYAEHIASAVL